MLVVQTRENDLGIVLLDALSYYEGWMSEERFAEKLQLSGKQVRKMLHVLQVRLLPCSHPLTPRLAGRRVVTRTMYVP
jgi:hypothetical protein